MSDGRLHLLKLCVGADRVADLEDWQRRLSAARRADGLDPRPVHTTRQQPRRAAELLAGGSLYWVVKGRILVRQRLVALEVRTGADGVARCDLVLDPELVRTEPQPRRPFQGWRYLAADDAPPDLSGDVNDAPLPEALAEALREVGVT